jgi:acyl carrier protein
VSVEARDVIRTYLRENMLFGDESVELSDDVSLFEEGVVDSTGVLELVMFIEQRFDVAVETDELVPDNFESIAGLARFVDEKRRAHAGS